MELQDLPDQVGANAVVNLSALTTVPRARVVQFVVTLTGSPIGAVRVGHPSTVGASRGLPLNAGGSQFLPYAGWLDWWTIPALAMYIPAGFTVSIALGL